MSAKNEQSYFVFTPHGAIHQRGESVKIALARFLRLNRGMEVLGIFREDLIVKPPRGQGAAPFLAMFNQGELKPRPNPEDFQKPKK